MIHICNGILAIKKEQNSVICSNIDGPRDHPTEWSKPDTEKEIAYDIASMWNLKKKVCKWTYLQNRSHRHRKADLWLPKGKGREG